MSIDGTYYIIRHKESGRTVSPAGTSSAPHLYSSRGKAEARRKSIGSGTLSDRMEVVPVQLIELKEGV